MTQLGYTISQDDLPESQDFSPIPAGEYRVKITEASIEDTKDGKGQYIKLRLDVTGPSHEGRVLFTNLNIKNPSQKAEEIGRQQLGSVMRAIGLETINDTDQLIGGDLLVKVAVKTNEQYGEQNEVKAFKAVSGSKAPGPAASGEAEKAQSKPPWAK